ncbi:hypothetical protein QBC46DRAFT_375153 [Diplogelasinospora grovesii]|uniref:Uncharacterized protein n=1 Tax=Diplogelasinospora grovesii TaxID=303347 RepID=A0AAN6S7X4_9PEZI|nr:hypothetical protein QBC46DRAFT_375153 [Diplogelasinospora grovesii]
MPEAETIESFAAALKLFEKLGSVKLDAAVVYGKNDRASTTEGDWRAICGRAGDVYLMTMHAIIRSGRALTTLSVYANTPRCSIPCECISRCVGDDGQFDEMKASTSTIKNIALSVSMRPDSVAGVAVELSQRNITAVARLLAQMPNLESIDLHLYKMSDADVPAYHMAFDEIARTTRLKKLKSCALRGWHATEESLLRFLSHHPDLEYLELRELVLLAHSFDLIFNHVERMPVLAGLRLSNLWYETVDRQRTLKDLCPAWQPDRCAGPADRCWVSWGMRFFHTWYFDAADIQKGLAFPLIFPLPTNADLVNVKDTEWATTRRFEFGPPVSSRDFDLPLSR